MALFALSDLHLSISVKKPMDIFGISWHNYMDRISSAWHDTVSDDDLVIIGGDVSWATYLNEAKADFEFLNSLPGKKLILRGNHDYWWESVTKLRRYMSDMKFNSIEFLHNSSYIYKDFIICGTRLWLLPESAGFSGEDKKIYERELIRLELSLNEASRLQSQDTFYTKIAVFHYPPIYPQGTIDVRVSELLKKHRVTKCIYGHLHGGGIKTAVNGKVDGIEYRLTSADSLDFTPYRIEN